MESISRLSSLHLNLLTKSKAKLLSGRRRLWLSIYVLSIPDENYPFTASKWEGIHILCWCKMIIRLDALMVLVLWINQVQEMDLYQFACSISVRRGFLPLRIYSDKITLNRRTVQCRMLISRSPSKKMPVNRVSNSLIGNISVVLASS